MTGSSGKVKKNSKNIKSKNGGKKMRELREIGLYKT